MNENVKVVFGLIGGLALFLYGMNSMSDALQKAAGEKMKKILEFLTKNPIMGALAGALVTAVLQSSSATTVMVIGFVSAGLMSLPQAISVIFFFNVIAAVLFPVLGNALGFDTTSGNAFGVFAGTAINDTSSVTAAASTWDSMWNLGSETLNTAVTVKLTRTLAIIPITLVLSLIRAKSAAKDGKSSGKFSLKRAFPMFILYFIIAAVITTVCMSLGVSADVFAPLKELSKFFIIMAMAAIGLNSNVVKLVKSGGKPILLGASCWVGITVVSLAMQHIMHIW